jgi:hypothetical protein
VFRRLRVEVMEEATPGLTQVPTQVSTVVLPLSSVATRAVPLGRHASRPARPEENVPT